MKGKSEVEQYYDTRSKTYDDIFDTMYFKVYDKITWKYIEPYVPTNPDSTVLDAGGGTGRWSILMARKGPKVVLMDLSEEMLKIADTKIRKEHLQDKISIKKGDITETGFADEIFDMVLCEHTLFLFERPEILLKELRRVLKKEARLIISAHNRYVQCLATLPDNPNSKNLEDALNLLLRGKYHYMTKQGKVKISTWTPEEFRNMLRRSGFTVEKIVGKGFSMPLRISKKQFMAKDFQKDLLNELLKFELVLCEKPDSLALAGLFQAIVKKL